MSELPNANHDASGRFAPVYSADKHAAVRTAYETTPDTLEEIGDKQGVGVSTIHDWAKQEGWVRRRPRHVDPNDLVGRMLYLLDRQMSELETAMNNGAAEVALLAKLVTTLDKVLLLKDRALREPPRSSKRVEELRAKIVERIVELNKA